MLVQLPESVTIVALDGDELVLVRQTRAGANGQTLELPSGCLEPGETPAEAAVRELAEECSLAAEDWQEIATFWGAPAYSTEFVHVFAATGLVPAVSPHLDPDEDIEVERVRPAEAAGRLSDANSIAALALWQAATAP